MNDYKDSISGNLVKSFWNHMTSQYGTRVIDKNNAIEMKLVAWFLQAINVLDAQKFLQRYATTIGKRIYVPFAIGGRDYAYNFWSQIVICCHEHQHIEQILKEGFVPFAARYISNKAARAAYEAEAYISDMELYFWRTGKVLSPKLLANNLLDYGCRSSDVKVTEKTLNIASYTVRGGGVINRASKKAIDWLNAKAPQLHYRGYP